MPHAYVRQFTKLLWHKYDFIIIMCTGWGKICYKHRLCSGGATCVMLNRICSLKKKSEENCCARDWYSKPITVISSNECKHIKIVLSEIATINERQKDFSGKRSSDNEFHALKTLVLNNLNSVLLSAVVSHCGLLLCECLLKHLRWTQTSFTILSDWINTFDNFECLHDVCSMSFVQGSHVKVSITRDRVTSRETPPLTRRWGLMTTWATNDKRLQLLKIGAA